MGTRASTICRRRGSACLGRLTADTADRARTTTTQTPSGSGSGLVRTAWELRKGVCFDRQHTRRTTTTRGPIRSAGPRTRAAQTVDGPAQRRGHNKVEPAATDAGVWMWVDCRSVAWCAGEVLAFREMCRQAGAGVVVGRDANRRWEPAQAPRGGRIWVLGCRGGSAFGCGGALLNACARTLTQTRDSVRYAP